MKRNTKYLEELLDRKFPEHGALEVISGPEDGRLCPLSAAPATVGRLETADIVLGLDSSVSRRHARITCEGGCYFIEDMGSTHGTAVNGRNIATKTELKDGDEIVIGSSLLRVRRKDA
jgi:pSer/pThr/pTyr-binding forkhead associated (FHA) protein